MSIYIGTSKVKEIYLGTSKVKEIYLGTDKIFGETSSEWNLIFDGGSNTYTSNVGASSDTNFGPSIDWVEGKIYRIVFDCEVTAKSSTNVSIIIRNQAQSYTFFTSTTLQVGDVKHIDDSYTETRSRKRTTFVGRRAGSGNSYSVNIYNVKIYEHI